MRKRVAAGLLILLLCVMLSFSASAEESLDNETTVVITRNSGQTEVTPSQTESCFWEYPQLTAGQHRDDGTLWLSNMSGEDITVTLSDFQLPLDNPDAVAYLKALHLTVKAGGKTVFDDTYDKAGNLSVTMDIENGEKKPIGFELGCDFTYKGESSLGDDVIYGKYTVEYHSAGLLHSPVLYIVAGAVAAVVLVIAIIAIIVANKKKKSA